LFEKNIKSYPKKRTEIPISPLKHPQGIDSAVSEIANILAEIKSSLLSEQLANMRKTLSSLYNTKLMSIKAEYEVGQDNSLVC
jgi:flagellin-specific chaperone FliS